MIDAGERAAPPAPTSAMSMAGTFSM